MDNHVDNLAFPMAHDLEALAYGGISPHSIPMLQHVVASHWGPSKGALAKGPCFNLSAKQMSRDHQERFTNSRHYSGDCEHIVWIIIHKHMRYSVVFVLISAK